MPDPHLISDSHEDVTAEASAPRGGDGAQAPTALEDVAFATRSPLPLNRRVSWPGLAFDLLLMALIAIGVYFRFSWVNWNQDTDLHPDEYGLTTTLTRLAIPESLGDYFNTRLSPVSPYQKYDVDGNPTEPGPDNRMRWGQWPIILIRWTAELTDSTGYRELRLLGRRLSALTDTLALLVTLLIGWRLYHYRVGLLAAALSALAVMQIQQAHFMTADTFGVLFTALAMYCAVRVTDSPSPVGELSDGGGPGRGSGWGWYALFGVAFGMALASRINLLPLFGEIVVAAVIACTKEWKRGKKDLFQLAADAGVRLALAGAVGFLTFRVTQPMTFRAEQGDTTILTLNPNPEWVESMEVAQAESSGRGGGPPGEQWTNRPALVFPFVNMVLWGMGLPLGLVAWAGLAWAAWRALKDEGSAWAAHLLPLTWAGGYFLFMGTRWVKSIRYFLPIYPFLALFAAWALVELWNWRSEVRSRTPQGRSPESEAGAPEPDAPFRFRISDIGQRAISVGLTSFVLVGTLAWAWGFTSIYRTDNTRVEASRWIYQNVAAPFNLHLDTPGGPYTEPLPAPSGLSVSAESPHLVTFTAQATGTTTGFTVGHARNVYNPQTPGVLHIVLAADPGGTRPLAQTDVFVQPRGDDDPRGESFTASLGSARLTKGMTYYLLVTAPEGGPLQVAGSTISNENWDEGLPLRLDERDGFGGLYHGLEMSVRWQDNEEKRQMFLENLSQVDYIILPSQRGIWSASRLPNTYPLTIEYYRALFDGRLGFDLAAQFQSPIRLGPLQISDVAGTLAWGREPALPPPQDYPFNNSLLAAEEAFSVYDHAPVWIFTKRADFDIRRATEVLYEVDLSQVVNQGPREATESPTLMMLPRDRLVAQRVGGTWRDMFDADGMLNRVQPLGVLAWWLTLLVMGWLAFPLTYTAFGGLADHGYLLAKSVALVFLAWFVWILGSFQILPFTRATIALGVGALAMISGGIYWMRRAEFAEYLRAHRRHLVAVEAVTLALFAFDLLIRLGNPDLWHPNFGGEKPMDFSYFNAVLKSSYFPPYDPWLAGGYLNYYYYGFVVVGLLVKLLGIVPAFAYNLILPTLFALLGMNAFCIAYNLVKAHPHTHTRPNPYLAGVAAALLIVVLGNLGQVHVFITGLQRAADHAELALSAFGDNNFTAALDGAWRVVTGQNTIPMGTGEWYWNATRIINGVTGEGNEITEFPFFTFLYADLHANMMALPFAALSLAWAVAYVLGSSQRRPRLDSAALWLIGGLAFGMSRPTHTWDYPVYLVLGVVAVVAGQWLRDPRVTRANLWSAGWRAVLLMGLSLALYRPYDQWYVAGYTEAKLWDGLKTPLDAYLYIHGLFLFILMTFLVWETRRWLAETPASVLSRAGQWLWPVLSGVFSLAIAVAILLYQEIEVAVVALPLMTWAGLLLLRSLPALALEKRIVLFLLGTALTITLVVELVTLQGDVGRMNTIFKFYLQVWTLFSVAAAPALAWVWAALPEWKRSWRWAWAGALTLLTASAALYTLTAASAKIRDRFPPSTAAPDSGCSPIAGLTLPYERGLPVEQQPHSLYGLDYMKWSAYCDHEAFLPLVYDHKAIRWLQDNVPGSPVIAEAQSFDLYRMSSRYAWNTGLPDVVGWDWHQRQQRTASPTEFITERGVEVTNFYVSADPQLALDFLSTYEVRYIIVGPMERAYYAHTGGLDKFDVLLSQGEISIVHQNPGVTIYEVQGRAAQ